MNFRKRDNTQQPGFQLAPMIDVIFILLSFFIATQIFSQWETEIDVRLPTSETGKLPDRLPGEVIINIQSDGAISVNNRVLDGAGLRELLARIVALYPGQPVLIRADRRTAYEHVIGVLDLCRQSDIWNISFATGASRES
jgi:biopolymer transport protein ExbD